MYSSRKALISCTRKSISSFSKGTFAWLRLLEGRSTLVVQEQHWAPYRLASARQPCVMELSVTPFHCFGACQPNVKHIKCNRLSYLEQCAVGSQ